MSDDLNVVTTEEIDVVHAEESAEVEILQEELVSETENAAPEVLEVSEPVESLEDNSTIVEPSEGLEGSGEVMLEQTTIEDLSDRHPAAPTVTEIPVAQTL